MLLMGGGAIWFQEVKEVLHTWDEAIQALRASYGAAKPTHQIYRELFAKEQNDN